MREFIRHPTDIPIQYKPVHIGEHREQPLNDIGEGGLSFRSCEYIEPGTEITIRISIHQPEFEEKGIVVWSTKRENEECWDIGVLFADDSSDFRLRMIEQVCHIEHYRKEVREQEGRELSGTEAAAEWVKKYAKDFPK